MKLASTPIRSGMTLLEVVVSLAIFLFSVAAVNQLMLFSSERVLEANLQTEGALLCQSKMAEVMIGVVPPSATGYASLDTAGATSGDSEAQGWEWKLECEPHSTLTDLTCVKVYVKKERPGRPTFEMSVSQFIYNPSKKGSTLDAPVQILNTASPSGGGSGTNGSGNGGQGNGGM